MDNMIPLIIFAIAAIGTIVAILLPAQKTEPKPDEKSDKIIQATAKILDILQLLTLKMKEFEERLDEKINR